MSLSEIDVIPYGMSIKIDMEVIIIKKRYYYKIIYSDKSLKK